MLYQRYILPSLKEALQDTPVVLVNGARQTGKTTLVQKAPTSSTGQPVEYRTLDEATTLATAKAEPHGFIDNLPEQVIIDEVQHCPELFPAIKLSVDRNRIPGRFILTGSANIMLLPKLSESLAGRMEILTLYPLSESEITGGSSTIVDNLFAPDFPPKLSTSFPSVSRKDLADRILQERLSRTSSKKICCSPCAMVWVLSHNYLTARRAGYFQYRWYFAVTTSPRVIGNANSKSAQRD